MQNPVPSASSSSQPDMRPVPAWQPAMRGVHQATMIKRAQTPGKPDPRFLHEKDVALAGRDGPHLDAKHAEHIEHSATTDNLTVHAPSDHEAAATALSDAIAPRASSPTDDAETQRRDRLSAHRAENEQPAWVPAHTHSSSLVLNPPPVLLALASTDASGGAPSHAVVDHASASPGAVTTGGWSGVSWGWLGILGAGVGHQVLTTQGGGDVATALTQKQNLAFTLSGGLLAGPIINKSLIVTAYDANGQVLGSTTTHQDNQTASGGYGYYTLTINHPAFSGGVVLLRVSDPTPGMANDFIDEATGLPTDIADLRAVLVVERPQNSTSTGTSQNIGETALQVTAYITPLTTLAAELIAPLPAAAGGVWTLPTDITKDQITDSNGHVAELFGLSPASDLITTQPVAVMSSAGVPLTGSNAYGKALAVLSLAQAHNTGLSVQALADDLRTAGGSDGPLKFSAAVAPQLQVASLQAVNKSFLSTADAFHLQQATTAGTSTQAIDFRFERPALTLDPRDPADALGQSVYRLTPVTSPPDPAHPVPVNGLRLYNVNTADPARFRLELQDTVAGSNDANAFTWDFGAGSLELRSDAASQVQGPAGYTYQVTLRATADLLATPHDPADDVTISQALTLTVRDTTAPRAPSAYSIAFKPIDGVQTQGAGASVTTVGTLGVQNPEGFLTLSGLAPPDEAGVHYQVDLTLRNRTSGQAVTRRWSDWFPAAESAQQQVTYLSEIARLGDGTIDVQASVTAIDLANLRATPVLSNTSFVLDTVVSTPTVSMLNYPASSTSGDGWLRLAGLEQGASYAYTVFRGMNSTSGPVESSLAATPYRHDPGRDLMPGVIALDFHDLGSGDYTIHVTQQDAVGNQSTTTQSFTLDLESPTGVDASIDAFEFIGSNGLSSSDTRLFYLNSEVVGALKGTWKGHLEAHETLQLGVGRLEPSGTVTWQWSDSLFNLLEPDATGVRRWNFDANQVAHWRVELPSTLSGGSLLGVRLVDSLGHANLLTTRNYVYQTQEVLLPPVARWDGASATPQETTDSTLNVVVSGLAPHAQAQYRLSRSPAAPAADDSAWSALLPQPIPDDNTSDLWFLHIRQQDLLTQQVSASGDPLVIHLDTEPPAPVTGLLYQPLDGSGLLESTLSSISRDQVTRQSHELDTGWVDINGQPVFQGQVVTVLGEWTDVDEGATLSVQWGHVLKTHTLSLDDIYAQRVDLWWSLDDLLNQPGQVTVRAWVTDLSGHTSTSYSRSFDVDSRQTVAAASPPVPKFLGLFTRSNTSDAYVSDVDNTLNKSEVLSGVQLRLQLGLQQADGSAVDWSQGFKLMLYAKSPSDSWSSTSVTTGTLSAGSSGNSGMAWNASTGQVDWTLNLNNPLGNSLFSNMQGS